MSIWCSWEPVGWDFGWVGGQVHTCIPDQSHLYPTPDSEHPAAVEIAHIPAWCVPGHTGVDDDRPVGDWLRLSAFTDGSPSDVAVVMDEAAVEALRDQLTEWLERPKVRAEREADS